jgi:hypothetical protein
MFHHHYVNYQATFWTYNLYLSISLMVSVAIRALKLEYLDNSDSGSTALVTSACFDNLHVLIIYKYVSI